MPTNGHVIPGTPIAVDFWNIKQCPQVRIFFLSHFHSDHINGLTSSWQFPIYASPTTCEFLLKHAKIEESLIKSLEIEEDHQISLDYEGKENLTVTLFHANHCPGAVMFLFSGYFGNIFYTGDFRYTPKMLDFFLLPSIDVLYLDNTFCSSKCNFPKKVDALELILQQVHVCLVKNDRLYLGLDHLGKEEILIKIAKERHCKIHVSPSRRNLMEILGLSDIITDDQNETKIFVVPTNQINGRNLELWNKEKKTHAILITARFYGFNFQPYARFSNIHVIPYSNHSSYSELIEFVKVIRPKAIIPILGKDTKGIFGIDLSERADMSIFQNYMQNCGCPNFNIPKSVKMSMELWAKNFQRKSLIKNKKRKISSKN